MMKGFAPLALVPAAALILVAMYLTGNLDLPATIAGQCTLYEGQVQLGEKSQGCLQPDPCGYGRQATNYCLYYPKTLGGSAYAISSSNCPSGSATYQAGILSCKALAGQGLLFNSLTCQSDYGYIGSWEIITKQYTTQEAATLDGAFGTKCIKTTACTDGEKANIGCSGTVMTYNLCVNGAWQPLSEQCALGQGCKSSIGCVSQTQCIPNQQMSYSCSNSVLEKTMCNSDGYSTYKVSEICNPLTETCETGYCVPKNKCGDGFCDEFQSETATSCYVDCGGVSESCNPGDVWNDAQRKCTPKPLSFFQNMVRIVKIAIVIIALLVLLSILAMLFPFLAPLSALSRTILKRLKP